MSVDDVLRKCLFSTPLTIAAPRRVGDPPRPSPNGVHQAPRVHQRPNAQGSTRPRHGVEGRQARRRVAARVRAARARPGGSRVLRDSVRRPLRAALGLVRTGIVHPRVRRPRVAGTLLAPRTGGRTVSAGARQHAARTIARRRATVTCLCATATFLRETGIYLHETGTSLSATETCLFVTATCLSVTVTCLSVTVTSRHATATCLRENLQGSPAPTVTGTNRSGRLRTGDLARRTTAQPRCGSGAEVGRLARVARRHRRLLLAALSLLRHADSRHPNLPEADRLRPVGFDDAPHHRLLHLPSAFSRRQRDREPTALAAEMTAVVAGLAGGERMQAPPRPTDGTLASPTAALSLRTAPSPAAPTVTPWAALRPPRFPEHGTLALPKEAGSRSPQGLHSPRMRLLRQVVRTGLRHALTRTHQRWTWMSTSRHARQRLSARTNGARSGLRPASCYVLATT